MIQFKAITPGKPFQSSLYREEVLKAANEVKRDMLEDFHATTRTWEHEVTFGYKVDAGASVGGVRIQIATDDPVYGYVDQGTKAHTITAREKRALAFKSRYKAKTRPTVLKSYTGGASGKQLFRQSVHHPGTQARKFTKTIHTKWQPKFRAMMQDALKHFAERTGYTRK